MNTPAEPAPRRYPVTGQRKTNRTSFKDLTGHTYGRWSVLAEVPKTRPGQSKWKCRCSCGTTKTVLYCTLVSGDSRSCGCLKAEKTAAVTKQPHERHSRSNPTWRSWANRRARMPLEWRNSFDTFLADMGPRPDGHKLTSMDGRRWDKETCVWGAKAQ